MYASYSKEKIKIHRSAVLNHGIIATLIICTYMQVCTSRVTYLKAKMVIMVRANYFCNIISPVIYIHMCIYIYIHVCMYVYICIYNIYIYIYIYIIHIIHIYIYIDCILFIYSHVVRMHDIWLINPN